MHPVVGKGLSRGALALGYLVFVMGKFQILAAAMDIKGIPQIFLAHGAAFDMPARPSLGKRAFPCRFPGFLRLPEREIHGIFFHIVDLDARPHFQIVQILPGELAIVLEALGIVIYVAVFRHISVPFLDKPGNQADNILDMLSRLGVHSRRADIQALGVFEIFLDKMFAQLLDGNPLLVGSLDHLVVNVRKILDERDLIAPIFQIPAQCVKNNKRTGVSDMKIVVYRGAAGIDPRFPGMHGNELFLFSGHGIKNFQVNSLHL